jgi:hypothetical protein
MDPVKSKKVSLCDDCDAERDMRLKAARKQELAVWIIAGFIGCLVIFLILMAAFA